MREHPSPPRSGGRRRGSRFTRPPAPGPRFKPPAKPLGLTFRYNAEFETEAEKMLDMTMTDAQIQAVETLRSMCHLVPVYRVRIQSRATVLPSSSSRDAALIVDFAASGSRLDSA